MFISSFRLSAGARRRLLVSVLCLVAAWPALADEGKPAAPRVPTVADAKPAVFKARDTVAFPTAEELKDPAKIEAIASVQWKPADFEVACAKAPDGAGCDAVVAFVSPRPSGNAKRDRVVLHWHKALGKDRKPLAEPAPAVFVLSPLSPSLMDTSDAMARRLAAKGFHAFAIALPGAGPRHADPQPMELLEVAAHPEQAVADLRRARDAVAALPGVNGKVGVEAMCFGALAAIPAQAIDNAFDGVVVGFVGGDINAFFNTFQGTMFRLAFMQSGWSEADLGALATRSDPGRAASRIKPEKFHFYSFSDDGMWPKVCTDKLLKDLNLPETSRTEYQGMHNQMFAKLPSLEKRLRKMLALKVRVEAGPETKAEAKAAPTPSPKD